MASKLITLSGKLPAAAKDAAGRISAYLVSGNQLLSETSVQPNGNVQFRVADSLLESSHDLRTVIGPSGLTGDALADHSSLPAVAIDRKKVDKEHSVLELPFNRIEINKEIIASWWSWCREYCVSGTV